MSSPDVHRSDPALSDSDNAGVRIPPPLIFLGFLILGIWYDSPWFSGHLASREAMVLGGLVTVLGLLLIVISVTHHKNAGSNVEPWKPTTAIISTGVYRFSRNPIYLGMALTHGGIALCGGSMAAGLTLALSILVIRTYVITREENYLTAKFGETYNSYKKKVRRWI